MLIYGVVRLVLILKMIRTFSEIPKKYIKPPKLLDFSGIIKKRLKVNLPSAFLLLEGRR